MDEFNNNLENKPLNEYEIRRENKRRNRKKSGKSVVFLAICFSLIGSILGSAVTYNFLIRSNMNSSVTETEPGSTTPVKINASDSENVGSAVFKKVSAICSWYHYQGISKNNLWYTSNNRYRIRSYNFQGWIYFD